MMEKSQDSSGSKHGESVLSEYRRRMLREKAAAQGGRKKEEIEQLAELADDLNALFEQG